MPCGCSPVLAQSLAFGRSGPARPLAPPPESLARGASLPSREPKKDSENATKLSIGLKLPLSLLTLLEAIGPCALRTSVSICARSPAAVFRGVGPALRFWDSAREDEGGVQRPSVKAETERGKR